MGIDGLVGRPDVCERIFSSVSLSIKMSSDLLLMDLLINTGLCGSAKVVVDALAEGEPAEAVRSGCGDWRNVEAGEGVGVGGCAGAEAWGVSGLWEGLPGVNVTMGWGGVA